MSFRNNKYLNVFKVYRFNKPLFYLYPPPSFEDQIYIIQKTSVFCLKGGKTSIKYPLDHPFKDDNVTLKPMPDVEIVWTRKRKRKGNRKGNRKGERKGVRKWRKKGGGKWLEKGRKGEKVKERGRITVEGEGWEKKGKVERERGRLIVMRNTGNYGRGRLEEGRLLREG